MNEIYCDSNNFVNLCIICSHVDKSGDLEQLVITNMESARQGTKRITAVTGKLALQVLYTLHSTHILQHVLPCSMRSVTYYQY